MRRFLKFWRVWSSPTPKSDAEKGASASADLERTASSSTLVSSPTLPPPKLTVKRFDYYYHERSKTWKHKDMDEKVSPTDANAPAANGNDPWQVYCFVVVRTIPATNTESAEPTFQVVIKSPYLRDACKNAIGDAGPAINWSVEPLSFVPNTLLLYLPLFEQYRAGLEQQKTRTEREINMLQSIAALIDYLYKDYGTTIANIERLRSRGEITFDLLYALLLPTTLFSATCPVTGEPIAVRLTGWTETGKSYTLHCQGFDARDETEPAAEETNADASTDQEPRKSSGTRAYGWVNMTFHIGSFEGTRKINDLSCYPMEYHLLASALRQTLIERGRKWASYSGVHHVFYKGMAFQDEAKYNINSRAMVDSATFRRLKPNYAMPKLKRGTKQFLSTDELTEGQLMMASPVLYGFSLSDKIWLELNVEKVSEIQWNDEAFANLVLPPGRKSLLLSLVEAHQINRGDDFDDFVKGKGHGLVVNLFGPPGVGKTLSAEATSEHVRRPLYVVGSNDLGRDANTLDSALQSVFDVANTWKAIVLIDEADVFLEQRSLHDLERNAMVAVFLRHLEYYAGILFFTTNRVKTFDEAFLSRVHVALHFGELSQDAKMQIWAAFLRKVRVVVTQNQLAQLAGRTVNGREIKNAARTASSLALGRGEELCYAHVAETLDAMAVFTSEFRAATA
ncbi:ATPase family AAA domain-containing protein [Phanerochaete sordida]|uniref:ATPase family AAA domain-containing protein n=1 Tax=Phanerochaete sordida TaxID=48140 RepID=A0A9P3FXP6_9APHY|nr:ATPase family AAA domain-containing protein [Phanerochaete sordida]